MGLFIICLITGYFAGALISAPRLMRLIYQEKMTVRARQISDHEEAVAEARKAHGLKPYQFWHSEPTIRREARFEGWWWSLLWPFALTFHAVGASAFKQEIAAQHAEANAKVIANYEKLLNDQFDKELAVPGPRNLFRRLTQKDSTR